LRLSAAQYVTQLAIPCQSPLGRGQCNLVFTELPSGIRLSLFEPRNQSWRREPIDQFK
jgi:hypothetical protein